MQCAESVFGRGLVDAVCEVLFGGERNDAVWRIHCVIDRFIACQSRGTKRRQKMVIENGKSNHLHDALEPAEATRLLRFFRFLLLHSDVLGATSAIDSDLWFGRHLVFLLPLSTAAAADGICTIFCEWTLSLLVGLKLRIQRRIVGR